MRTSTACFLALTTLLFGLRSSGIASSEDAYAPAVKIKKLFKTSVNDFGRPLAYPKTDKPEATMLYVELPPGAETGWHTHPVQGYGYVISGTLTIATKRKTLELHAGQGFVETTNLPHDGKNLGKEPVKLVVVFTGERGQPYAVRDSSNGSP